MTSGPASPTDRPLLPTNVDPWSAVAGPRRPWREVRVLDSVASTNDYVVDLAKAGEPSGLVVATNEQRHGHGRLDRDWECPPGAGLTFSVLVRPAVSLASWGWAPLLTGVAIAEALEASAGVSPVLKWPNDVLIDERKLAGVLAAHVAPDGLVVGIGINTDMSADELPVPDATSLRVQGVDPIDRQPVALLCDVLIALADRLALLDGPVSTGADEYRARCSTIGRDVEVSLPGGKRMQGTASGIADDGRLIVTQPGGHATHISAGDVIHLR